MDDTLDEDGLDQFRARLLASLAAARDRARVESAKLTSRFVAEGDLALLVAAAEHSDHADRLVAVRERVVRGELSDRDAASRAVADVLRD